MSGDLALEEATHILGLEKFWPADDLIWQASPEHGTQMICMGTLTDASGATIPGLTVELAFRVPARFDDCKYTFTVFAFKAGGSRQRVYQLEVIPPGDRGHNDAALGALYGPHEHVGTAVREVKVGHLGCEHHENWFREFLMRANIGYGGRYFGPFDGGLFT
jgi:hypothetical protein